LAGFIIGVVGQATALNYIQLMLGRTLVGLGCGVGEAVDPMYIGELAPAEHRGELVSWAEIGIDLGVMLGFSSSIFLYTIDDELEWRVMLGLGAILPAVMIYLCLRVMPESPRWLLTQQQDVAARDVLEETYPIDTDVDAVVRDIKESIELERVGWKAICRPTPAVRRMLLVGVGVATMQQIVGIDAIML
jgi:MFS family permease